jgi:hypothetical protein
MLWVNRDTCHGAHLNTLRLVKVTHAFRAFVGVNFINFCPKVNGLVGTLRFAHIAIDAFVGNQQSHKRALEQKNIGNYLPMLICGRSCP